VALFTPDTLQETPFYLMAEDLSCQVDSLQMNFGRYEFLPTDPQHILFSVDSLTLSSINPSIIGKAGMAMPTSLWVTSTFFLLFVACFVILSLVFRKEGVVFMENFRQTLFPAKRQTAGFKGQVTTTEAWGEFFLLIQAMLVTAILCFTFLWDKGIALLPLKVKLLTFAALLLLPVLLTSMKLLIYRIIALFFMPQELKRWISNYYRILELMGILLFLPAMLSVFLPELKHGMLFLFLLIFVVSRLVIVFGLLNIFVKNKVGGFYFFVYLCGTEIAPYLMFYKGVLIFIRLVGNIDI